MVLMKCKDCHHEWQKSKRGKCYTCGCDGRFHAVGCAVMTCDWCGGLGEQLVDEPVVDVMDALPDVIKTFDKTWPNRG